MACRMRDMRRDAFRRRHGHVPGVDHVDVIVTVDRGQPGGPLVGLVLAEIDIADAAVLGARDAAPWPRGRPAKRREAVPHILLDELAEKADALPCFAIEL